MMPAISRVTETEKERGEKWGESSSHIWPDIASTRHPHEESQKTNGELYLLHAEEYEGRDVNICCGLALNHWFFVAMKKMLPLTRELFMQETRKLFATLKRHDSFSTLLGVISTRKTPQHMKIILKRVSEKFSFFSFTRIFPSISCVRTRSYRMRVGKKFSNWKLSFIYFPFLSAHSHCEFD
jgi:hypothetical protein